MNAYIIYAEDQIYKYGESPQRAFNVRRFTQNIQVLRVSALKNHFENGVCTLVIYF